MKGKKYVLFDLDGTLTDSGEGIMNCAKYALRKIGVKEKDFGDLRRFMGPPLKYSFKEFYKMDEDTAERAVVYYRELYIPEGMFQNSVYDGIIPLLAELHRRGKQIAVATAKPEVYSEKIAKELGLSPYLDFVCGAELEEHIADKSEIIGNAIRRWGDPDKDEIVMIGDRKYDIEGAETVGIASIGVLYGYGEKSELINAGAGCIAEKVEDIAEILE